MKRVIGVAFLLIFLASCSTVTTEVYKSNYEPFKESVLLRIANDSWGLEKSIAARIEDLGFSVTNKESPAVHIHALVDYETFWDVVHQTFNHFEIVFVDAETRDVLLKSRYVGRFGFNGCEAALDLVFKDIGSKL